MGDSWRGPQSDPKAQLKAGRAQAAGTRHPTRTTGEVKPCTDTDRGPRRGRAGAAHGPLCRALHPPCFPVVSALPPRRVQGGEQAVLRNCVPPAATQDTRGRSSARVPCCSPRSHTVSWWARPAGTCPAASSRWAPGLALGSPSCCGLGWSRLQNHRGRPRDGAPRPGLSSRQQEGKPRAPAWLPPARALPGAAWVLRAPGTPLSLTDLLGERTCSENSRAHTYLAVHMPFPSKNELWLFTSH